MCLASSAAGPQPGPGNSAWLFVVKGQQRGGEGTLEHAPAPAPHMWHLLTWPPPPPPPLNPPTAAQCCRIVVTDLGDFVLLNVYAPK